MTNHFSALAGWTRSRTPRLVLPLLLAAGAADYSLIVRASENTESALAADASAPASAAAQVGVSNALAAAPLLGPTDLVYQGAFRVPQGQFGGSSFDYGGTALAFNPARGSLFMVGHAWQQQVAEVTIPPVSPATTALASLPTAAVIQRFADATDGRIKAVTPDSRDTVNVGGLLPYQGKLYLTAYVYYDGEGRQKQSHFVSGTDLSVPGDVRGPYEVGTLGAGFVSGYFGLVPAEWQGALGGPVLNGNCCLSIISRTSHGPAVFAVDPTRLGTINPLPITPLVYYPNEHQTLGEWGVDSTVFNGTTTVSGVVFPEGTRSVLFFGRQGLGQWGYGTGTSNPGLAGRPTGDGSIFVYDPAELAKGGHGYPYSYYVWAYDAADLAAVKSGQRQPWDVVPYAIWRLDLPFANQNAMILGAAYDPQSGRIFVSQEYGDGANPLIHVFSIGAGSSTPSVPPTVSLLSPKNGATFNSRASVNVVASASDRDGTVASVAFYANGTLIGTTSGPYSIDWLAGAAGTYQISAVATDNAGNNSPSNVATVFVAASPNPSSPPTVSLVSPTDGATFGPTAPIRITATANDSDGFVKAVDFYANGVVIGTATSSPYAIDWSGAAAGTYRVLALATDNSSNTATSASATVVVRPASTPPNVRLTTPSDGSMFAPRTSIRLLADASDADGTVSSVTFYANGNVIGTVTSSPYSLNWSNAAAGTYRVLAVATDNTGQTSASNARTISVGSR